MRLGGLACLSVGVALVTAACSSDALFSSGGPGTPTGTGASTTSSNGGGGQGTTTSSGLAGGGQGGGGNTTTTTSTGGGGGAGGAGGALAEIPCNQQTCSSPNICCLSYNGPQFAHCALPGSCGGDSLEVDCDGPSDCPEGQLCCGRWVPDGLGGDYVDVVCSPTCQSDANTDGVVLCDVPADCSLGTCLPSQWLPAGFSYCAP